MAAVYVVIIISKNVYNVFRGILRLDTSGAINYNCFIAVKKGLKDGTKREHPYERKD